MLIDARAVEIKPKPVIAIDKLIIFSATSNDETAYSYKEKSHGMFTYFLLKKIQASQGNCTYKELGEFIYNNVTSKSIIENGKTQTTTVQSLMNGWGLYKLLK